MVRLSDQEYWNSLYERSLAKGTNDPRQPGRLRRLVERLFGKNMLEYTHPYEDCILWNVLYPKIMPREKGMRIIEIGSAPGHHLVRLARAFGYVPYGVEYSEAGVRLNRMVFASHNIDPSNVIHADFLSDEFQSRYRHCFDIVLSRGFIEHFSNPDDVVQKHVNLLSDGGHLVVTIPNLTGWYYPWEAIFDREVLAMHNTQIMDKEEFGRLFHGKGLKPLYCDYYGLFTLYRLAAKKGSLVHGVLWRVKKAQPLLDILYHVLRGEKEGGKHSFSPTLMFAGVRE